MLIIPLILSSGLDMSLPEFQPYEDASGNYIVSEYDVSFGEGGVVEVPSDEIVIIDVSENDDVIEDVSSDDVIEDVSSGERSIEPISFKAAAEAGLSRSAGAEHHLYFPIVVNNLSTSSGYFAENTNHYGRYVYLTSGTYYFYSTISSSNVYVRLSSSVPAVGVPYTSLALSLTNGDSSFTLSDDSYVCIAGSNKTVGYSNYIFFITDFDIYESGSGDVSGGDIDLTGVILAVENVDQTLNQNMDAILDYKKSILFVLLITFLYPLALSIVKNIVGGDSNV